MAHPSPDRVTDWPLWWFSRLEAAIERGDYRTALQAQHELERLGVTVTYRMRRQETQEGVQAS